MFQEEKYNLYLLHLFISFFVFVLFVGIFQGGKSKIIFSILLLLLLFIITFVYFYKINIKEIRVGLVTKIIFILFISLQIFSSLSGFKRYIEPYTSKINLSLNSIIVFLIIYIAYALWYTPSLSYVQGGHKDIYIAISYEYRFYYQDYVYLFYREGTRCIKIYSKDNYDHLLSEADDNTHIIKLNIKNYLIRVKEEWRRKIESEGINITITENEIIVSGI